jgi:ferredoxin
MLGVCQRQQQIATWLSQSSATSASTLHSSPTCTTCTRQCICSITACAVLTRCILCYFTTPHRLHTIRHGIELEGACEGVCACSTCHVILEPDVFDRLPEASEDEEDMLDQAFGLTASSRLGCQVVVTPDMDGIAVQLPAATRNFYVDGHVPVPH